ncbi:MAG: hypothetical protein M3Y72_10650 [Acidobacteriota bacterium]|nr:hypothetical protein [Acidobacteriota bacterium]
MWFFTEIANGFDRMVHEDEVFLENWGTEAAAKHLRNEGSIELGAAPVAWAGFKLTTTVSKGFVDVLRIGDGVKKGGWGYGEDALRGLVVVGPALRGIRIASGLVVSVDANASMGNCAWVAAARGARLSGRLFASIKDVAKRHSKQAGQRGRCLARAWKTMPSVVSSIVSKSNCSDAGSELLTKSIRWLTISTYRTCQVFPLLSCTGNAEDPAIPPRFEALLCKIGICNMCLGLLQTR